MARHSILCWGPDGRDSYVRGQESARAPVERALGTDADGLVDRQRMYADRHRGAKDDTGLHSRPVSPSSSAPQECGLRQTIITATESSLYSPSLVCVSTGEDSILYQR